MEAHFLFNNSWSLRVNGNPIRALALKDANAISKPFLAFYGLKCAASKDAKHNYCKNFYNSATVQFYL